jgi:tetratricopeptide (TPR) repeat protein
MGISGAFGGILDVLQIIDIRRLVTQSEPIISSYRRFFIGLILGAIGGIGGGMAMLFTLIATSKLNTANTPENTLMFLSLGTISGFLGYKILRNVAQRVDKQIQEAEQRTEKKIDQAIATTVEKIEKAEDNVHKELNYHHIVALSLFVIGQPNPPSTLIRQSIIDLEDILKRTPNDRQASIILSNAYAKEKNYKKSIEVLTNLIKLLESAGNLRIEDIGDALYNRACIRSEMLLKINDESEVEKLKKEIYTDLQKSFQLVPSNKEEAKADPDFENLINEEEFKRLTT